ncbi:unnamed protein product [Lactuca saligna]|uniref:Rab-GAP TBC domain-containing protein n=1 Tax=Lactuca saligna TaxID=75948 RepID=A0AA35Z8X1_LACSI|nr:unnamed protein product [Lactuca saligna]
MMGLSYFMLNQSKKDAEYCTKNTFSTYLVCLVDLYIREGNASWWIEMLKSSGQYKEVLMYTFVSLMSSFYEGDDNPNVHDISMTCSFYNFDLGYCQGLNDLSPISLFIMKDESQAFWCYLISQLLQTKQLLLFILDSDIIQKGNELGHQGREMPHGVFFGGLKCEKQEDAVSLMGNLFIHILSVWSIMLRKYRSRYIFSSIESQKRVLGDYVFML